MPPEDFKQRFEELQSKVDAIYGSVEKMRKYFQWTLLITLALVVLPAVGLVFAIPSFLSTYQNMLDGSDGTNTNNLNNLKEFQDLRRELGL